MIPLKHLFRETNLLSQLVKVRCAVPSCGIRFGWKKPENTEEEKESENESSLLPADDAELAELNAAREAEIERNRNRSNLHPRHRNIQNDIPPQEETDYSDTVLYKRKMFGKFGKASGVHPSMLWPSTVELSDMKEYEQVAHPYTVHELISREKERQQKEAEEIVKEKQEILENVAKVDAAIFEFRKKLADQLNKEIQARTTHDKTVKELRKYFGYNIARNDPRVAVYMEKKALEERKAKKEAKKKQKIEERKLLLSGELKLEDVKKVEKPKAVKKTHDEEDELEKKAAKAK